MQRLSSDHMDDESIHPVGKTRNKEFVGTYEATPIYRANRELFRDHPKWGSTTISGERGEGVLRFSTAPKNNYRPTVGRGGGCGSSHVQKQRNVFFIGKFRSDNDDPSRTVLKNWGWQQESFLDALAPFIPFLPFSITSIRKQHVDIQVINAGGGGHSTTSYAPNFSLLW